MRSTLSLLIAILIAPTASAGVTFSGGALEGESGCTGYAWYDYGGSNSSYWSSYAEGSSCTDEFDYVGANVSDDSGTLAAARVGTSDANSSSRSGSSSSYSYPDGYSDGWTNQAAQSSSWWRGAEVTTAAGSADAGDGCTNEGSYGHSSYRSSYYGDPSSYYYENREEQYASSSDCGPEAGIDAAGRSERIDAGQQCSFADHSYDSQSRSYSGDSAYSWTSRNNQSASNCSLGAGASGEADTWAGIRDSCASDGWERAESSTYGNDSYQWGQSHARTNCKNGLVVEGPDGISFFAGTTSRLEQDCSFSNEGEQCTSHQSSEGGFVLAWEHSPLGPTPIGFFQPLP